MRTTSASTNEAQRQVSLTSTDLFPRTQAEQSAFQARVAGKWAPDELTSSSSASVPYNVDERSRDGLQFDRGSTQHHLITEEEGKSTREAGAPPPPQVKLPFTTNAPLTACGKTSRSTGKLRMTHLNFHRGICTIYIDAGHGDGRKRGFP